MRTPQEADGDIVVVHHLIRRLGRRPTAAEVREFCQQQQWSPEPGAGTGAAPTTRPPGSGHR